MLVAFPFAGVGWPVARGRLRQSPRVKANWFSFSSSTLPFSSRSTSCPELVEGVSEHCSNAAEKRPRCENLDSKRLAQDQQVRIPRNDNLRLCSNSTRQIRIILHVPAALFAQRGGFDSAGKTAVPLQNRPRIVPLEP